MNDHQKEQKDKIKYENKSWRKGHNERKAKFDDTRMGIYLKVLEKTGKPVISARAAGICMQTVRNHREMDHEFKEEEDEVLALHAERIVDELVGSFVKGEKQGIYNKDGDKVGEKTVFETAGRVTVLKKYDHSFREKADIDVNIGGGVLVAPPEMSVEAFIEKAKALRDKMVAENQLGAIPESNT